MVMAYDYDTPCRDKACDKNMNQIYSYRSNVR